MKEKLRLSVVIPLYNEEDCVMRLHASLGEACDELNVSYELIFVDDGSQDQTFPTLRLLHESDPKVKVIRFRRNFGQTAAMAAGFAYARGEIIVSMDGDLQNDPADIPRVLAKLEEGYDIVCGWRKDRKDKLISRRVPSVIANWLIAKMTDVSIHDNGCSLKAYEGAVIKRVALYSELHRFIPAMSTFAGARIAEIEVRHHPRQFGKSKYGISRAWRVFLDLLLIKMLTGFGARPALWFATLSVPAWLLGITCLVGMLVEGVSGVVLPTLAFLSFSLVGHFMVMGLLGEMSVKTGDFRPERMLAGNTIRQRQIPNPIL